VVAAHVTLAGLPGDFLIHRTEARSRFELAGTTLQLKASGPISVPRADAPMTAPDVRPLQYSLGVGQMTGRFGQWQYDMWPGVLAIGEDAFARYARTPGRLTADIDFHVQRYAAAQVIPLRPGPFFSDTGRRVEVVRIDRSPDSCTLFLRDVVIDSMFAPRVARMEEIVLRNAGRGEALRGDQEWQAHGGGGWPLMLLLNVSLGSYSGGGGFGQHGFTVREYSVRYPSRGTMTPALDPSWLANAEIVRVTADYAGYVSRSIAIDNFQMVR
jgi:hypothetical protein